MKFKRLLPLLAAGLAVDFAVSAQTNPVPTNSLTALFSNINNVRPRSIPRRPSIIFIQCRDLAAGDLSCYGQTNYQTPNLDALATNGVLFTKYSGGPEAAQTTAQFLAGDNAAAVPGEINLARLLQKSGYKTGLMGEWPYDRTPWLDGFDMFAGYFDDEEARDYFATGIWRYPHIAYDESNRVERIFLDHEMLYQNVDGKQGRYLPDLMFTAGANFVANYTPDAANHWRPFFLFLNLSAPRSASAGKEIFPVPSDAPFTGEAWPQEAKNRAALVTRIDSGWARLLEQLKKSRLTNNNVAVVFSSSCAPEKFTDANLNFLLPKSDFRGTNNLMPRLPLIFNFPAKLPRGKTSQTTLTPADLAPTLAQIAYADTPTNFLGISILTLLENKPRTNSPVVPDKQVHPF
jgi:arylsulfatase A-like enzyme